MSQPEKHIFQAAPLFRGKPATYARPFDAIDDYFRHLADCPGLDYTGPCTCPPEAQREAQP